MADNAYIFSPLDLPPYQYEPLENSMHPFRLFGIYWASRDDEVIAGTLMTMCHPKVERDAVMDNVGFLFPTHSRSDSNERLEYEDSDDNDDDETKYGTRWRALSYEWGSDTETIPITIDGQFLHVRKNLHDFLLAYRRTIYAETHFGDYFENWPLRTELEWIWIDQISINQADLAERSAQVQMMHAIYQHAAEVIAWLADEASEAALVNLCYHDLMALSKAKRKGKHDEWVSRTETMIRQSFTTVAQASYWTRLWVQQEVYLANNVILASGDAFFACWQVNRNIQSQYTAGWSPILGLLRGRALQLTEYNKSLTSMLHEICHKRCADPRDKVFGSRALVAPEARVQVSYEKSVEMVFTEAFSRAIRSDASWGSCPTGSLFEVWIEIGTSMGLDGKSSRELLGDVIETERKLFQRGMLPIELAYLHGRGKNLIEEEHRILDSISRVPRRLCPGTV